MESSDNTTATRRGLSLDTVCERCWESVTLQSGFVYPNPLDPKGSPVLLCEACHSHRQLMAEASQRCRQHGGALHTDPAATPVFGSLAVANFIVWMFVLAGLLCLFGRF